MKALLLKLLFQVCQLKNWVCCQEKMFHSNYLYVKYDYVISPARGLYGFISGQWVGVMQIVGVMQLDILENYDVMYSRHEQHRLNQTMTRKKLG